MASTINHRQMFFQDENAHVQRKKAVAEGKAKSSAAAPKKNGAGFGSRKALNDITNKSQPQPKVSSKKKTIEKEKFNVAEERFLHDHRKCIEERQKLWDDYFLDLVLPRHDSTNKEELHKSNTEKIDVDNAHNLNEPEEMSLSEFSDWLKCSTPWRSPPLSPTHDSALPSSPLAWGYDTVEFKLKDDGSF